MTQGRWLLGGAAILPVGLLVVACGGSVDLFGPGGSGGASQTGGAGSTQGGTSGSVANGANGGQTNGVSGAVGSSGNGAAAPGDAGGPPEQPCGAGVGPATVPQVDPAQSAQFRWSSCGRIAPSGSSVQALYGQDGAILSLEEGRGVRVYTPGTSSSATLVSANSDAPSGLALGEQGARLLLWDSASAAVFEAADQRPIGVASGTLVKVVAIDTAAAGCGGPVVLSSDGTTVAAQGTANVCAWDVDQGALLVNLSVGPAQTSWPALAALTSDGSQVRVFRDGQLSTYAPSGERVQRVDLTPLWPPALASGVGAMAAFSADSATLLVLAGAVQGSAPELLAIDTASGAVSWRRAVADDYRSLNVSASGYALVGGDAIYGIDDGTKLSTAPHGYGGVDIDARDLEMLQAAGQVRVWDLARQKLRRLYGGHAGAISALDPSRDGNFLASHGGMDGVVWQLDPDFALSTPLFNGRVEGASQVAIAPDGDTMVLSGDVVALFGPDGVEHDLGATPVGIGSCMSTGWDYAPNGCFVSGMRYSTQTWVYDAEGAGPTANLASRACASVAFSPDSSRLMTAQLELFDTSDWSLVWSHATPNQPVPALGSQATVAYSPDGSEVVVANCGDQEPCQLARYDAQSGDKLGDLPQLSAARARYSPEGHWIISGGQIQHLPTGKVLTYDAEAKVGVFAPNGDIIAGETDGSLVRYCRSDGSAF